MGILLKKYQQGNKLEGPEFTYAGRPGSTYRKTPNGTWFIKNKSTNGEFIQIKDSSGSRSKELNRAAKVRSTTLRTEDLSTDNTDYEAQYLEDLKFLENGIKSGFSGGKWKPHHSVEGGSDTIAYGHKLKKGEDFSKGITEEEAVKLLMKDYQEHKTRAENHVDNKYGQGTFSNLSPQQQILLTDYEYNVGLSKFPSFTKGVIDGSKKLMMREYKRYTGGNEMTQRNEWAEKLINKMRRGGILYKK
jgi:GH24 family phage-related lysozyme (muramidase)